MDFSAQETDMEQLLTVLRELSGVLSAAASIGAGTTSAPAWVPIDAFIPVLNTMITKLQSVEDQRRVKLAKALKDIEILVQKINNIK